MTDLAMHPQLRAWLAEQTEPCEYCTARGRVMGPPTVLAAGWYQADPFRDGRDIAIAWNPHTPAGCRDRRPEGVTGWADDVLRPRSLQTA